MKGRVSLSGSGRLGERGPGRGRVFTGEAGSGSERCCQKTGKLNKHEPPGRPPSLRLGRTRSRLGAAGQEAGDRGAVSVPGRQPAVRWGGGRVHLALLGVGKGGEGKVWGLPRRRSCAGGDQTRKQEGGCAEGRRLPSRLLGSPWGSHTAMQPWAVCTVRPCTVTGPRRGAGARQDRTSLVVSGAKPQLPHKVRERRAQCLSIDL